MSDQKIEDGIAAIKLRREVLKRLSELLQDRPDLRAKTFTKINPDGGGIFRELLSTIRNRQLLLAEMNKNKDGKDETIKNLSNILKKRLVDFSSQTMNAMGNAIIWIPKEANAEQRQRLTTAFSDLSNISADIAETPIKDIGEVEKLHKELTRARDIAKDLLADAGIANLDLEYIDIRISDLEAMNTSMISNSSLVSLLGKKDYTAYIKKLQKELNAETVNTVLKLSSQLSELVGISDKADEAIEKLSQLMERDLIEVQNKTLEHKLVPWAKNAVPYQEKAAEIIKEGVGILDYAVVEFIKEKNKIQPELAEGAKSRGEPGEDTISFALEEQLAAMEKEVRQPTEAKMSFGMRAVMNVKVKKDWETDSKEKKKEIEEKRREIQKAKKEQQAQAKKAQRNAAKTQMMASGNRDAISERLYEDVAIPWANRNAKTFDGDNTWNKLSSELKESLNQDVDSDVPDAYRDAIEQYFREIADENKER